MKKPALGAVASGAAVMVWRFLFWAIGPGQAAFSRLDASSHHEPVRRSIRLVLSLMILALSTPVYGQPYRDAAVESGLAVVQMASGAAVADYDLDGDLDIYMVSPEEYDSGNPATWNRLFRNRGDGTFEDVTEAAGVMNPDGGYRRGQMGNRFGVSWGDYDGDRFPDLFLTRIGPDRLFHNLGDGTFEDVTVASGVFGTDDSAHDVAGLWCDFDGDGDLDLYVSAWIGENRLYRNNGDGTFTDIAAESGVADNGFTWSSMPLDVNRDGRMDLYVVNDFGANHLYVQSEDGRFEEATAMYGLEDEGNGMGVAMADLNEDGWADIYVTNIAERAANPMFMGGATGFSEQAYDLGIDNAGWAWGAEFFDADLDGDQDLYVVNGFATEPATNRFFERLQTEGGGMFFSDESVGSGIDALTEARSLVVFDREGDGDLDLLVANFRTAPALYERIESGGNWIGFWLEGPPGNVWGVGAEVILEAAGNVQRRYQDGVDFLGQSLVPAHFGLGAGTGIDRVEVRWPNGQVDRWEGLPAGEYHTLSFGASTGTEKPEMGTGQPWPGTDKPQGAKQLELYPNPVSGDVAWITGADYDEVIADVFDVLGRKIATRKMEASGRLDLSGIPQKGLFLVRFRSGRQVIAVRR
jgi:VCBS repeat protein/ASPIC/UnbV protein